MLFIKSTVRIYQSNKSKGKKYKYQRFAMAKQAKRGPDEESQ